MNCEKSWVESNFKVGDHVRVRYWEDMLDEYGYAFGRESINTPGICFIKSMTYMSGFEYKLTMIDSQEPTKSTFCKITAVNDSPCPDGLITLSMLESIDKEPFDAKLFDEILGGDLDAT